MNEVILNSSQVLCQLFPSGVTKAIRETPFTLRGTI